MTKKYWHSVTLDRDACKGCTNCIKLCPTQAIRVQNGKAKIIKERCIDCGECIRICPYHAKKAVTDSFDMLNGFKYNIALVAPAFYGQFSKAESIDVILTALIRLGFDEIFEAARGAQQVSRTTREMLKKGELPKPAISSACPAVERLIAVRFPNLIENIIPLRSPMEVSAMQARRSAAQKTGIAPEDIGVFFISPCAAKMTNVKASEEDMPVSGVISIKDTFLRLANKIGRLDEVLPLSEAGFEGVLWATSGGEADASGTNRQIAVDGIHNVIKVLEAIENGKLSDIEYVEVLACTGGCVGGPLTVENNFVARSRIRRLAESIPKLRKGIDDDIEIIKEKHLIYRPVLNLDEDMEKAMEKRKRMEEIYDNLPHLDCGSCGAPNCRALAEDIVRGFARETDCIFKLRERVRLIANEMIQIESHPAKKQEN